MGELHGATARAGDHCAQNTEDLLAIIAHELRSPLSSLAGWLELLGLHDCDDTLRERALPSMQRSVRVLTRMVGELTDKAQLARGVFALDIDQVSLSRVVHDALEQYRPAADRKGVLLLSSMDEALPEMQGDAGRLQQAVANLVGNALKFTPPGGHVVVALARRTAVAEITVRDNGRGMDPAATSRIFEPYVRLGGRAALSGLGLGLHIALRLVELHGGTIGAHSAGEGLGSTFTVQLPLTAIVEP